MQKKQTFLPDPTAAIASCHKVSEVELIYRTKVKIQDRPMVHQPKDLLFIFLMYWNLDKIELIEEFKLLLMNRANRVIGIYEVSSGGLNGTVADQRLIFAAALKAGASGICLCHNHPSGNIQPSEHDKRLTRQVKEGGVILNITLIDHLIIAKESYYSFAEEGLL